jgi:hypothetical protein
VNEKEGGMRKYEFKAKLVFGRIKGEEENIRLWRKLKGESRRNIFYFGRVYSIHCVIDFIFCTNSEASYNR